MYGGWGVPVLTEDTGWTVENSVAIGRAFLLPMTLDGIIVGRFFRCVQIFSKLL